MLKEFALATSLLTFSQATNAQNKMQKIDFANKQTVDMNMTFNAGDTLILSAQGKVSVNKDIQDYFGDCGPCGYKIPGWIPDKKIEAYKTKYHLKNQHNQMLPTIGALVIYQIQNGKNIATQEFCSLPKSSKKSEQRVLVFTENNTQLQIGLNTNRPDRNEGDLTIISEIRRKNTTAYTVR